MIKALYRASQAGVPIDLSVRGICCLRPGVSGVSDGIRVSSVVGRFLEHSRVFSFGAGDEEEIFISSADWMPRNFYRRVELMTPILDEKAKEKLRQEILEPIRTDNCRARDLQSDGTYVRREHAAHEPEIDTQDALLDRLARRGLKAVPRPLTPSGGFSQDPGVAARRRAASPPRERAAHQSGDEDARGEEVPHRQQRGVPPVDRIAPRADDGELGAPAQPQEGAGRGLEGRARRREGEGEPGQRPDERLADVEPVRPAGGASWTSAGGAARRRASGLPTSIVSSTSAERMTR